MKDFFTYERYRGFLSEARKTHQILSFRDVKDGGADFLSRLDRFLILRHDIDFSVEAAHNMAVLEYDLGVTSSFFFLFSDSYYNPLGRVERPLIHEIVDMGHDIGLHFDWDLVGNLQENEILDVFHSQKTILEHVYGVSLHAVSSHLPMRSQVSMKLEDLLDTYAPEYTVDIKYISDSIQTWREKTVEETISRHPRIQLLIHPRMWAKTHLPWQTCLSLCVSEAHDTAKRIVREDTAKFSEGLTLRKERDKLFQARLRAASKDRS